MQCQEKNMNKKDYVRLGLNVDRTAQRVNWIEEMRENIILK